MGWPVSWLGCLTLAERGHVIHWGWERNSPAGNLTPVFSILILKLVDVQVINVQTAQCGMSSELCMPSSLIEGTVQLINVAVTNRKAVCILHKIMKFCKGAAIDNKQVCYSFESLFNKMSPWNFCEYQWSNFFQTSNTDYILVNI